MSCRDMLIVAGFHPAGKGADLLYELIDFDVVIRGSMLPYMRTCLLFATEIT